MIFGFELTEVLFYAFSAVLIAAAIMVVTARNPVYSALYLVLTFFTAASLWLLLQVEFLAIVLVVVYVGAVMVLFLFVVMMLDINLVPLKEGFTRYLPVGILVALVMGVELLMVVWGKQRFGAEAFPPPANVEQGFSNTRAVGEWMYTQYLLPFEVAGLILLVAIIAAIALTVRQRPEAKKQNPARQVRVTRAERIRMVNMKSEHVAPEENN